MLKGQVNILYNQAGRQRKSSFDIYRIFASIAPISYRFGSHSISTLPQNTPHAEFRETLEQTFMIHISGAYIRTPATQQNSFRGDESIMPTHILPSR
jgi:hypothetical protein